MASHGLLLRSPPAPLKETILIFRLGSIGDTVVALPCFHLIACSFPNARRIVVTNRSGSQKAAPLESVLGNSGLIDGTICFPPGMRQLRELLTLRQRIRETDARTLIYLAERKQLLSVFRDVAFFLSCGLKRIIGAPLIQDLHHARFDAVSSTIEWETERLAQGNGISPRSSFPVTRNQFCRDESRRKGFKQRLG
jgi:lipopolysaccharide heptosyltransferase III